MQQDTLSNFIANLGKTEFDVVCRIIIQDILHCRCVNVDGKGDGGTDFVEIDRNGSLPPVAYQITTQKDDINRKAWRDAKKAIKNYNCDKFLFFTTKKLTLVDSHRLGNEISTTLGVATTVYFPQLIAGLLIGENLVSRYLEETHSVEFTDVCKNSADYRQMTLYGYSLMSDDSISFKKQTYDDALLVTLAEKEEGMLREELVAKTIKLLSIPSIKSAFLLGRVDSLMSRKSIIKSEMIDGGVRLHPAIKENIMQRKQLYAAEISGLSRVIADLMKEYNVNWTLEDTRKSSVFIAGAYISKRLEVLQEADASLLISFAKVFDKSDLSKLRTYLLKNKKLNVDSLNEVVDKILNLAANHPLIEKLTRAAVYIGLEGTNPLASARVIGAYRWSDVNIMIEPTIGIPWLCSYLFNNKEDEQFKNVVYSIDRAKKIGARLRIPYVYIEECAGHLLMARKFNGLDLNAAEMQYSSNAFVANYYRLKSKGATLPASFLDYLSIFAPAIKAEHSDMRMWRREILTTMQSYFTRNGIEFEEITQYDADRLNAIIDQYADYLDTKGKTKKMHLLRNDAKVLNHINERISQDGEHWMMITYDRTLIEVAQQLKNLGWVCAPTDFIDMTAMSSENGEETIFSLIHSVASMSERTLSIGARILDNIIMYASKQMQEWEFKQEVEKFKEEMVQRVIKSENKDFISVVDKETEDFLKQHGVNVADEDESAIEIVNIDEEGGTFESV